MNKSKKTKKNTRVRDIKPKKDAKGGGPKSTLPITSTLGGTGGLGGGGGGLTGN